MNPNDSQKKTALWDFPEGRSMNTRKIVIYACTSWCIRLQLYSIRPSHSRPYWMTVLTIPLALDVYLASGIYGSYRNYGSSPRTLCFHVVILRASKNLAERWCVWIGRDPSTLPGGVYPMPKGSG